MHFYCEVKGNLGGPGPRLFTFIGIYIRAICNRASASLSPEEDESLVNSNSSSEEVPNSSIFMKHITSSKSVKRLKIIFVSFENFTKCAFSLYLFSWVFYFYSLMYYHRRKSLKWYYKSNDEIFLRILIQWWHFCSSPSKSKRSDDCRSPPFSRKFIKK